MTNEYAKKPPLGLMPEWRHKELRLQEIREAVQRCIDAKEPVPINWIAEEYAIRNWLECREEDKKSAPTPAPQEPSREWEIIEIMADNGLIAQKKLFHFDKKSEWMFEWQVRDSIDGGKYYQDFLLSQSTNKIHSVKRLSDGEIFTVGDEVGIKQIHGGKTKILEFDLSHKLMSARHKGSNTEGYAFLDHILKVSTSEGGNLPSIYEINSTPVEDELTIKSGISKKLADALDGVLESEQEGGSSGCRFCDSGRLRTPNNPSKDHDTDCPYKIANDAINEYNTLPSPSTKESKPILFTTEDGVALYNREDKVVAVDKHKIEIFNGHNGDGIGTWINGWYTTEWVENPKSRDPRVIELINEHYLLFSTEEKANEFILLNKPCLSVKDVISESFWHIGILEEEVRRFSIKALKSLAKQKTNKP